jgi:hypothetical protein
MATGSAFAEQKQIVRPAGTAPGGNFSPGIPRPTRTTVVVSRLVGDGHIEITVTARK